MKESTEVNQAKPVSGMEGSDSASASDTTKAKYQQALNQAFAQMDIQQKESWDSSSDIDEDYVKENKRQTLKSWLNRLFRIKMTDGRILSGYFVCTDADANVVLQATSEFTEIGGEERILGLVMIPGRYIVSIEERNPRFTW
ncbi:N-alpha-acetyltransferase 38, NatC auxiliary subunit isoform X2 [Anopheles moucheti]|uniref:N-alpha-acetyltransferase 38, NatC auxiliary subunit isoform X2 n=1 Tax=Anopheles moucheti TaxID=186751 RepID=UPI0022F00A8B|nr:N-alpha-acetyltransferase 38, NatC auxiliary subunit isoform X2 [Anopheles moucheti]